MDEALVPHARRLRIGRSNFRLLSDIKSKESTLQLVYDVLHLTPFFKAFLVTTDVLEIYMQEFWATVTDHHHSIRFKIDNKKHIVNLESFREMLHIGPRLPHQPFVEPPFEEEIMAFLWFLGYNRAIRRLTDVNINKLHQPWRSFAAIINKCLTEKSSGYDILRWNTKIQRRVMRCIILGATPPKPKASVRKTRSSSDTTITPSPTAAVSGSGADEGIGSIPGVPDVHTDESKEEISWNSTDEEDDDDEGKDSDGDDEGNDGDDGEEGDDNDDEGQDDANAQDHDDQEDELNDEDDEEEGSDHEQASDEEEFIHPSLSTHAKEETKDEESFDPILKTPENTNDEGNAEENLGTNVGREVGHDKEEEENELYIDVNINLGRVIQMALSALLQDLPDFSLLFGFDNRLKTLEANFSEFMKRISLQEPSLPFLQVKEKVKVQVSKILPKIQQTVNEQPKAEVLTRSSNSSKTFYVVAADLSEMELKKILIEKMEGNKGHAKVCLEEVYKDTTDQLDWVNLEGQQYPYNLLKPLPLIPDSRGRRVIPFDHLINNDLEYLRGGASSRKYTTYVTKTKAKDYGHIKWIEDLVPRTIWIQEPIEDAQPTYRSDLKRKEAYIAYSNPRGFIYQNKDKQNRLMRIDELHKFNDGTLTDVRNALDDHL
nr:hypothetical protein [Tanacetum cinerariifolium]